MSTIVIDVDDKSSLKLFLDLAKELQVKATVLTESQKEDWALLSMMAARSSEPATSVERTLSILKAIM